MTPGPSPRTARRTDDPRAVAAYRAPHGCPRGRCRVPRAARLTPGLSPARRPPGPQTGGMRRFGAISGKSVGAEKLWMGQTHVAPATACSDHHHGASETAVHVVGGHPEFVFLDDSGAEPEEVRLRTSPGDHIFVPPYVPHREEYPDPTDEAVVVIARSTQEAIVVNLPRLYALPAEQG
ncbi:cupin [Streptomyces sp. NPDC087903]|uniref:cupin n=1 Tax=Streptomyces sp. NPDC087903 TaxID=3365819 RepID=UPI003807847F